MTKVSQKKTLVQRMHAIMSEMQNIPKNGYNPHNKYKYVMAKDVVEECRKLMAEHGVQMLVSEKSLIRKQEGKNFHSTIECEATFVNIDNKEDRVSVTYFSISSDTLDKDIFKAKTNGLKYLFIETFLVPIDFPDTEKPTGVAANDSHSPAAQAPQALPVQQGGDPGSYVVPFGKFKGIQIKNILLHELENYLSYVKKTFDQGKPNVSAFVSNSEAYLNQLEDLNSDENFGPQETHFDGPPN